jgi:hypothetical protein
MSTATAGTGRPLCPSMATVNISATISAANNTTTNARRSSHARQQSQRDSSEDKETDQVSVTESGRGQRLQRGDVERA